MARFGTTSNEDNTGRVLTLGYQTPVYAATLSLVANASKTFVQPATLTGVMTINAVVTKCQQFDELVLILKSDTTSRVVTLGTNFVTAGTIAPAISKQATISFVFDGVKWIEICRALQA